MESSAPYICVYVLCVFLQIVSAVQYCHQKHVIHRDLKVLVSLTTTCVVYFKTSFPMGFQTTSSGFLVAV